MSEHVDQLLGELGGEMEGDEGAPVLDDDYEPSSNDEEDADTPMELWLQLNDMLLQKSFLPVHTF